MFRVFRVVFVLIDNGVSNGARLSNTAITVINLVMLATLRTVSIFSPVITLPSLFATNQLLAVTGCAWINEEKSRPAIHKSKRMENPG